MRHSKIDPIFSGFRQMLVILAQTATLTQPGKSALNNPSFGQHLKAALFRVASNDLKANPKDRFTIMLQSRTVIPPIQKQQFPTIKEGHAAQNKRQSNFVLPIGRMHFNGNQPSLGINDNVSFASFDLFATIKTTSAPFSVVLTDWLSPIKTLGSALRSSSTRTFARNSLLSRCHVPLRLSLTNTSYTVDQGGKSCGNIRHEHPLRSTYKIALMYSRIFSGFVRFKGSSGNSCSHSLSFKSVGYAFLSLIPSVYLVTLSFTNTFL